MSDLDELEAIHEQNAFGFHGGRGKGLAHRHFASHCAQGHEYTEANTRWYKDGNRMRRLCRTCDKARSKGIYKPRKPK